MTKSEQARADARNSSEMGKREINLAVAHWYARVARYFIDIVLPRQSWPTTEGEITALLENAVYQNARKSARAAFRAVPGLRG